MKREITELWTLKTNNSNYLQKLVVFMPKRLIKVIEKDGWTTSQILVFKMLTVYKTYMRRVWSDAAMLLDDLKYIKHMFLVGPCAEMFLNDLQYMKHKGDRFRCRYTG